MLKNFYNCLQAMVLGKKTASVTMVTGSTNTVNMFANNNLNIYDNAVFTSMIGLKSDKLTNTSTINMIPRMDNVVYSYASYSGVIFGNGTAEVSPDDYKLSGDVITGIVASASITENDNNVVALYTIVNNNPTSVTISEIARMARSYGGSTSDSYSFLIDRQLLKEPITIEPSAVGQVTFTFECPIPS